MRICDESNVDFKLHKKKCILQWHVYNNIVSCWYNKKYKIDDDNQ